jgi:protein-disulfide isomerase
MAGAFPLPQSGMSSVYLFAGIIPQSRKEIMLRQTKFLLAVLLLAGLAGAQQKPAADHSSSTSRSSAGKAAAGSAVPSDEVVNEFLQQTFGYDSSLSWKVNGIKPSESTGLTEVDVTISQPQGVQGLKFYVTPDGHHVVNGEILPFGAHPYEPARSKLEKGVSGPARGLDNAPVTLVEFSDLQCPHCKEAQPTLDRLADEDKNVRIVFQNYPLPMHEWAMKAASYADCVGRTSNDAFWKFVGSVYAAQSDITAANADEKLTGLADNAGVKGTEIAACAAKPETTTRVQHSIDLGTSLDVNSTPTIFINGRKLTPGGIPYEVLQKMVDFAAKQK